MPIYAPNLPASLPVVRVTGTSQQMSVNTKYIADNASRVTLTLPATAALGEQVFIRGLGAGGWKIAQNSGQQITGGTATTTGTSGYIQSQTSTDTVALECIVANTTFQIIGPRGTLDVN